jgi:hypothetical protein
MEKTINFKSTQISPPEIKLPKISGIPGPYPFSPEVRKELEQILKSKPSEFVIPKKKEKEKKPSFAWQFATDFAFTVLGTFIPGIGLVTMPFRLMRMGKVAQAVEKFLANADKIKAFRLSKGIFEDLKIASTVYAGQHLVSQVTDKVEPVPLLQTYYSFLLGRGFLWGLGKGIKLGYQVGKEPLGKLSDYAYGKFPSVGKAIDKTIDAFFKYVFGVSREAWIMLKKLSGNIQPHLLEAEVAQKLFSALDDPRVIKELEQYTIYLRDKVLKQTEIFDDKFFENLSKKLKYQFDKETLKQLSDYIYLKMLQIDNLRNPILASFIERVAQGYSAPTLKELFWTRLKQDLSEIWEDSKRMFIENAWRVTLGAIKQAKKDIKIPKSKPKKEKELNKKAFTFIKHLYTMEGARQYRSSRIAILHYIFEPLFKKYGYDPFTLLTEGLKVNVDTKKLASMVERLNNAREQSFSLFLERLGKYALTYGTDFFFVRNRVWNLLRGNYEGLRKVWTEKYVPVIEDFYEQYISRVGFKHPLRKHGLMDIRPVDVFDPLDIDRVYSSSFYKFMLRYHPTSAVKPRFFTSIEDILTISIPNVIINTLRKHPHLIHDREALAEAVLREIGFTGGLTIQRWIANKFVVPQFMYHFYHNIDEVLKHPEIQKKLADPLVGQQEFRIMDKTVVMTTGMLDALKDYFIAITGRLSWEGSPIYSINRLWKRIFLFMSPFFHASALTLAGIALSGRYKITPWDIVGRAFLDSANVVLRGLSHADFGYMAKEVAKTIHELNKKGFKVHELILSGLNEGEALWGYYILTMRNVLDDLLKKGDPVVFKDLAKEFERAELKDLGKKIWNVVSVFERWLWAGYYQGLKLRTAYALVNAYKKGLMTADDLARNLNTINYVYGGLHTWFHINPKHAQIYRLILFAPDWYLSLFHNFRTWLQGDAPIVMNFFPSILRMRFYLSVYGNYAFNGHSPWDNYNLQDPKEWIKLLFKDWTELYKIHVPVVDSRGHHRIFTFNLLGFDIEPMEMVALIPFMKNLYEAITHPTMGLDQRILKTTLGTAEEWIEFWFRKASMIVRFFIKLYEATRPKFASTKEEAPTVEEVIMQFAESFAPLALVQFLGTVRYPYKGTPEVRDFIKFTSALNTIGLKTMARENLTKLLFANRHREKVVSKILTEWLDTYREVKLTERGLDLISPKSKIKRQEIYKNLLVSLSHAYYNYYMYPWMKENLHKDFKEIQRDAREILELIKEDIRASALPPQVKQDLWRVIQRRFMAEVRDMYRSLAKRDLPEIIEKRIEEQRMRMEVR